ncbi:MAG: hypothetical protein ABSE84_02025, partial [Isosphaeraceae bacterium]
TEPIQPWVAPAPPARHWLERFGPVAGCLVLVALLSWLAYQSLTPPLALTPSSGVAQQPAAGAAPRAEGSAEPVATNLPAGNSQPAAAGAIAGTAAAGDSKDATGAAKEAEPEATTGSGAAAPKTADNSGKPKNEPGATPPARAVPAGSVGVVDKVDGLLLRFHAEKREWERIAEGTSLSTSDRLVCLEPFRARILVRCQDTHHADR